MSLFRDLLIEKKRKPYYCEVEYLESTGTQYIDTGLDYFADFEVGIKLRNSVSNKALGNGARYCIQRISSAKPYWQFTTGETSSSYYDTTIPITEHHVMKWKDNKIYADDVLLTEFTKDLNASNRMYLYSADGGNKYPNMIYFCKLWEPNSGLLVRDFIPVLDWDMKPCMYDKISGRLFYNQNTTGDDFSYGREIHYVDYLESTGTQYIDTGVVGDLSTEINCEAAIVEAGNASVTNIMGNNVTSSRAITINMSANITNPSPSRIRFSNTDNTTVAGAINLNTFYKYNTNKTALTVKDTNNTVLNTYGFNATTAFTTDGNILIYKLGDTSTQYIGKIKVRNASITSNGTIVRDYLPAIDENGVGYMFDKVTHTIYDNAGTGAFKYPARETEYLQSTGTQYINTGYKAIPATTKFELDFTPTIVTDNSFIFGARPDTSAGAYTMTTYKAGARVRQDCAGVSSYFTETLTTTGKYTFTAYNNTVFLNNESFTGTVTRSTTRSDYDFLLFTVNTGGTVDNRMFVGKVYSGKLWDNGTPARDFIPALQDGQAGMLDKVNNVFYVNAGTGAFTTGKIVESRWF